MPELARGALEKMKACLDRPVHYWLRLGEIEVPLNPLIGSRLRLEYLGAIYCRHCGRKTSKSFAQGYCYPCFRSLPECDRCILSPELCHFAAGTCRDPAWGMRFCMTEHLVYLANSSHIKVGITRASQVPVRWLDQGAGQALPIIRAATRQQSGFVEDLLRSKVGDRTDWRAMLKGQAEPVNLLEVKEKLLGQLQPGLEQLKLRFGEDAIGSLQDTEALEIQYPVSVYPSKVASLSLDKTPVVEGTLLGIKGQYLLLDGGVINIRKHTSYQVAFSAC